MVNTEVKGTLAKLLATENLKVEHRKVSTACFDVHNRVLILPIWKTASATVYDLLVGHEVGHALYTPDKDFGDAPKDFVNVLEDARIERLMKVTYPGLRKSFFEGYTQLWEDDFFGVKEKEVSDLPFIDRINLYFKGKPDMPFSEEENVYVVRASQTKSFDEVIALAKELMEYAKQRQQEKIDLPAPNTQDGGNNTPNGGDGNQEVQPGNGDDGEGNDPADLDTPSYSKGIGGNAIDETRSLTEETLREALETLVDDNAKEWVYIDVPQVNLNDHVITWKQRRENFDDMYRANLWNEDNHYLNVSFQKCEEYKKSAQKSVNYLVKQFEMKKSARQYARAATSKTGVLDTNSLYKYKLTDDIFRKVTTTPDGKNHGLVMLLDWSGSMSDCLMDTLRQTYNLIWFCKKVNIPFRVYSFQSGYYHGNLEEVDYSNLQLNALHLSRDFYLLEFFSSEMNTKVLDRQMQLVWAQAYACARYTSYPAQPTMILGGTPLAEAVICMREIVAKMKSVEKVQKVNVVCLTDGESNPMSYITDTPVGYWESRRPEMLCHNRHKTFILRDPVTRYSRKIDASPYNTTREIVSFYREITDYNWIGIRLCSKHEMNRIAIHNDLNADNLGKQWQKERYAEVTEKLGFTKQFFMPNSYIGGGTDDLEVKTKNEVATKAELTRAFKKHMGSKMTNKTILNAFIEQIA